MAFDVTRVRAAYPALADGYAYLDGAAGTQVPAGVIAAISAAYQAGIGNSGGAFPASARADAITQSCREAVADLVGGDPAGGVFRPHMTKLNSLDGGGIAPTRGPGDEDVVSKLDHDANSTP